jgi:hypothetical protein
MNMRHAVVIDVIAAVAYVAAANPAVTGLALHEWLSIGCLAVFIVHCAVQYDWIIATLRHRYNRTRTRILNLLLDIATLAAFMTVMTSGLMVSRLIMPLLGLVSPGYFFWAPLHSISAKILLALLLVHLAVHLPWLMRFFARRKGDTPASSDRRMDGDDPTDPKENE